MEPPTFLGSKEAKCGAWFDFVLQSYRGADLTIEHGKVPHTSGLEICSTRNQERVDHVFSFFKVCGWVASWFFACDGGTIEKKEASANVVQHAVNLRSVQTFIIGMICGDPSTGSVLRTDFIGQKIIWQWTLKSTVLWKHEAVSFTWGLMRSLSWLKVVPEKYIQCFKKEVPKT